MAVILWILFYVLAPVLILELCNRYKFFDKIGSVLIAYLLGLIVGNAHVLPGDFLQTQEWMTTITIPLAIPLLLFSLDVKSWIRIAGKAFISMLLAFVSLVLVVVLGYYLFGQGDAEFWKISGLLVGVYTGGTPNLASLQLALDVNPSTYIMTHTMDMVLSAVYLLFLISVGQKLFSLILPSFAGTHGRGEQSESDNRNKAFYQLGSKREILRLAFAFTVSVVILAIGGLLSEVVPENISMLVAILTITSLGIAASFFRRLREIKSSFELGMYFILVFSVVVASMADISGFRNFPPQLFYYVSFTVFGTLLLHILLSWLFKVDVDTVIISSTALICSPPFVPVMAGALKNKQLILSGLTIGIIGYAVGNYLGISIAYILK